MPYLVYIRGSRGPVAQKWPEMLVGVNSKHYPHLSCHELKQEEVDLPINMLVRLYPPPKLESPFFECPGCGADLAIEHCKCVIQQE